MPTEPAKKVPAKKVPTKKAAPTPPPAKKAAPTTAPQPAAKKTGVKPPSLADGPYAWMLNRVRSTIVKNLPEDKRAQARKDFEGAKTFTELVELAKPYGFKDTGPALVVFMDQLCAEGITVRGGRADKSAE